MWRYFLPMALALVAIATSEMMPDTDTCFLLCDHIKIPGPEPEFRLYPCKENQVCMQTANYTTDILSFDNKKEKNSVVFLHRYCAKAEECKEHCRLVKDTEIMSCVSCMNSTAFGHEGKLIAKMMCHWGSGIMDL